ncbi:MAG: SAM-dependent methyltransferase [Planctomycetia bacterium]|nr:SAM-dependent methyltransferase [Planctomycetia bacterium]
MNSTPFFFVTSQVGAEPIIKSEVARQIPEARLAFSRPGFLSFKTPFEFSSETTAEDFSFKSPFARAWGFSLKTLRGTNDEELIPQVWQLVEGTPFDRIHVWGRDLHPIGDYKFEPRLTHEAHDLAWRLSQNYPTETLWRYGQELPARKGDLVLDCILLNPLPPDMTREFVERRAARDGESPTPRTLEWAIGFHRVGGFASALPGGMLDLQVPEGVVSRAWLKMEEALRWSRFPMRDGARVCEIGSAPGGATQALLARGCRVIGIDPAEMAPAVLENPDFRHIRSRIAFVKRSEFRKTRWLTCDINVPPNYTLDVVESIVMHSEVRIRGMLLTLKFPDWNMGFEVRDYLNRIKSWGFNIVRARQLHYSHQEICVACLKKPFRK